MLTTRSSKILCSQKCHNHFHYWRQKSYPGEGPVAGFKLIQILSKAHQHPNPNFIYPEETI